MMVAVGAKLVELLQKHNNKRRDSKAAEVRKVVILVIQNNQSSGGAEQISDWIPEFRIRNLVGNHCLMQFESETCHRVSSTFKCWQLDVVSFCLIDECQICPHVCLCAALGGRERR